MRFAELFLTDDTVNLSQFSLMFFSHTNITTDKLVWWSTCWWNVIYSLIKHCPVKLRRECCNLELRQVVRGLSGWSALWSKPVINCIAIWISDACTSICQECAESSVFVRPCIMGKRLKSWDQFFFIQIHQRVVLGVFRHANLSAFFCSFKKFWPVFVWLFSPVFRIRQVINEN